jgi:hypothetical protein
MARSSIQDHQTYGDAILVRLSSPPPRLKTFVHAFRAAHTEFASASGAVAKAKAVRDAALEAVGTADDAQDTAVDDLAIALVGARLAKRERPFSTFSKYTPSALKNLAYKVEAKEIGALVAAVSSKKPPAAVKAAAAKCSKTANAVVSAINAMTKPQLAYQKAITARDGLLPEWTLELNRLKREAAALWVDDPGTYSATFAAPERVASPKKRRTKKSKAAAPAAPTKS